jgi:hypothetical protein
MEHNFMKTLVSLALLFLVGVQQNTSCAQQKPPDASHFSILGVEIGQDSSESLENKLGKITKCHTNEHISIAGYTNSKEELIFEFGEVGGGDITGFYVRPSSGRSHDGCTLSPLPSDVSELTTGAGIRLGMTQKEFLRAFGPPGNRSQGGQWKYHWTWKANLAEEERQAIARSTPGSTPPKTADISVWIEARFTRRSLSYFHISKLETL